MLLKTHRKGLYGSGHALSYVSELKDHTTFIMMFSLALPEYTVVHALQASNQHPASSHVSRCDSLSFMLDPSFSAISPDSKTPTRFTHAMEPEPAGHGRLPSPSAPPCASQGLHSVSKSQSFMSRGESCSSILDLESCDGLLRSQVAVKQQTADLLSGQVGACTAVLCYANC